MKEIFKFRTHMLPNFKDNFRGSNEKVMCNECKSHYDSQEEIEKCIALNKNIEDLPKIRNIYENDIDEETTILLQKILESNAMMKL